MQIERRMGRGTGNLKAARADSDRGGLQSRPSSPGGPRGPTPEGCQCQWHCATAALRHWQFVQSQFWTPAHTTGGCCGVAVLVISNEPTPTLKAHWHLGGGALLGASLRAKRINMQARQKSSQMLSRQSVYIGADNISGNRRVKLQVCTLDPSR